VSANIILLKRILFIWYDYGFRINALISA